MIRRWLLVLQITICTAALADDADARRQADELAPLLSHYGAIIGPPDRRYYNRDDAQFHEVANRLAKQAATPALKEVANNCVIIAAKLNKSHALYDELTKDRVGPGKSFLQMMMWVGEQSANGAFLRETTTVRQEHNWTITETGMKDHTLEAALFYGTIGMMANREAEQRHQVAVFKLRQGVAKELRKLGDEVEQLRRKNSEQVRDTGFVRFAGPLQTEPRLEFKMGYADPEGSPIEIEWQGRGLRAAANAQPPAEANNPRHPAEQQSESVHPFLRVRNTTKTLHRVVLTIDYIHYRMPASPVMRQIYWLPEWKSDEVFAVTEAFRCNLDNRKTTGLDEEVNAPNGACGQQVFPGFLGLLGCKYSLTSDELRQEDVAVEFNANRERIRDVMLQSAEDLSLRLNAAASNSGEWAGLKANEKALRFKVMTASIRDSANFALALAPANWSEAEHAQALAKDFKAIAKRTESLRETALGGCEGGRVYVGVRDSRYAQFADLRGRFAIEFKSEKPTPQRMEVAITRPADGVNAELTKPFIGRLILAPDGRAEILLSLKPAPKIPLAGTKPSTPSAGVKPGIKPANSGKSSESPTNIDQRASRTPGKAWYELEWQFKWVKDHWECAIDQTEFVLTESKPIEKPVAKNLDDRPKPNPTGTQIALNQGAPGFSAKSVWTGTRKVTGSNGKVVKEERIELVVQHRTAEFPGTGGGIYQCELTSDGQRKPPIQVTVNPALAGRISWMTVSPPKPGERSVRGTDPYSGTINNGVMEVISQPTD